MDVYALTNNNLLNSVPLTRAEPAPVAEPDPSLSDMDTIPYPGLFFFFFEISRYIKPLKYSPICRWSPHVPEFTVVLTVLSRLHCLSEHVHCADGLAVSASRCHFDFWHS